MTEPSSRRSGYARLLDRAIRILAMRDHSEQELRRKLAAPVMSKNGPEALDVTPEELEQVVAELRQTIETYKITPEQLFPNVVVATKYAARRGIRRPPKYRNSEGQTWGGAGPRPKWLREAVARGESIEQYAIK